MSAFAAIALDYPTGLWLGLPATLVLAVSVWRQRRQGVKAKQVASLAFVRGMVLLALVALAARPVWVNRAAAAASRTVTLLVDSSESMGLEEENQTRYQRAVEFAATRLAPALRSAGLDVQVARFDEQPQPSELDGLRSAKPVGRRTNLGGAVAHAMGSAVEPPLAVIALTDGSANETSDNNRALADLLNSGTPFIGVGFGSDLGGRTLALKNIEAPPSVPTRSTFRVAAQLEVVNADDMPAFDLLLFRDGRLQETRKVAPGKGSRSWIESFQLTEEAEAVHTYAVQLVAPDLPGLRCVNDRGTCAVRVFNPRELRVLYIQGALTWDYKFVKLALQEDQAIKLTGLARTSKHSVFRQNVESSGELLSGFPTTLEEVAPFRVIVLSNIRPSDLSVAQQHVLAKFCGELGGGLLLIGGGNTFDRSWHGSRLEQLLPVTFSDSFGASQPERAFHLRLTEEALQHPVFQLGDTRATREGWGKVPAFLQYGRVDAPKPGAQVWATHESDDGPRGRRILMASQRYGAGLSAIIAIQNFWRWRLARESDPQQFDRFWRQIFRFLSDAGRQDISIQLVDQDLRPGLEVKVLLEKQRNPGQVSEPPRKYVARVAGPGQQTLVEQAVELEPLRPVELPFRAEAEGIYAVTVLDEAKALVASRSIEIRDINLELQSTGRDMETLRQWAAVSDGLAVKAEECADGDVLVTKIQAKIEQIRREKQWRRPAGINGWTLALLVGCLGAEWLLRWKWGMR